TTTISSTLSLHDALPIYTHVGMFDRGYTPNMYTLCNTLDRGVGNLITDLKATGDFGSTMIVMLGEFGRTPGPLNPQGGRDHWKRSEEHTSELQSPYDLVC